MDKLKQLLKFRLQRLRDSVLGALAKIEQLEVTHRPNDYTERTQLIGEIFMEHLEAHREQFVDELLREVEQLKQSNVVLRAEVEYLKTYTAPSTKFQRASEDCVKHRHLAQLLLEQSTEHLNGGQLEVLRRQLTEKYETVLKGEQQRYELDILQLQKRNCELQLELHQIRTGNDYGCNGIDEESVWRDPQGGEHPSNADKQGSPARSSACHRSEQRKGTYSTLAATPAKAEEPLPNFKYIRRPQLIKSLN